MNVSSVSAQPKQLGESLRLPPQALEAEQSVLGGLMLDNNYADEVVSVVNSTDFYRSAHQTIFKAICALIDENEPVDVVTVSEWLENTAELEAVGGLTYLGGLAQNTPNTANVVAYARIVRERAVLRRLITAGNRIVERSYNPEGKTPAEVLDQAEQLIFEIAEHDVNRVGGFTPLKHLLKQTIDKVEKLYATKNPGNRHGHRF